MQFLFFIVALTVAVAIASAEVDTQAKKVVKKGGASNGAAYLNVWTYGPTDVTCTGQVGYAISFPNNACWDTVGCGRRALEQTTKTTKTTRSSKKVSVLEKIFKQKKTERKSADGKALAADLIVLSNEFSVSQFTVDGIDFAQARLHGHTDNSCANFAYNVGNFDYAVEDIAILPLNACVNGDNGRPYKFTLSSEPAVPQYPNGYIAKSSFAYAKEDVCAVSPYGAKVAVEAYSYEPIGICDWEGTNFTVNGNQIFYTFYDGSDCTNELGTSPGYTAGECGNDYFGVDSVYGNCAIARDDIVLPAATPKAPKQKVAAATSLRM